MMIFYLRTVEGVYLGTATIRPAKVPGIVVKAVHVMEDGRLVAEAWSDD